MIIKTAYAYNNYNLNNNYKDGEKYQNKLGLILIKTPKSQNFFGKSKINY